MKEVANLVDEPCSSWICSVQVEKHIGGQSSKAETIWVTEEMEFYQLPE